MLPITMTIGGKPLSRDGGESVNRSTYYVTDEHSLNSRSIVQFYRTFPKRSGQSRGAAKAALKYTKDVSVANADGSGSIVLPVIWELSASIPVGVEDAVGSVAAFLKGALDNASIVKLFQELDI